MRGRHGVVLVVGVVVALVTAMLTAPVGAVAAGPVKAVSLQVGASATEAKLSWFARSATGQVVQYAPRPAGGGWPSRVTTIRASTHRTSEPRWTGARATLTRLRPGVTYLYRVGSSRAGWSVVESFTAPGGQYGTFLAFGDPQLAQRGRTVRGAEGWARTLAAATRRHSDARFLLSVGDQVNDPRRTAEWDAFYAPPHLRRFRTMTVPGNHDVARRSPAYGHHVALPNLSHAGRTVPGTGNYHLVDGATLLVGLNSNAKDVDVHRRHLRSVLRTAPAHRWTVVVMHHAPFSGAGHVDDADVRRFRAHLTPEFSRLGVDLVLSGHDHSYVRSHLMNGPRVSTRTSARPTVLRPRRGEVLYLTLDSSSGSKHYALDGPHPWAAAARQTLRPSYTAVTTSPTRLTAVTYDDRGRRVDAVTLRR